MRLTEQLAEDRRFTLVISNSDLAMLADELARVIRDGPTEHMMATSRLRQLYREIQNAL